MKIQFINQYCVRSKGNPKRKMEQNAERCVHLVTFVLIVLGV